MWIVYKHTSPNGKAYIGITSKKDLVRRTGCDGQGYKNNKHLWSAIKKYGWDNFEHEVLFEGLTKEEACNIEKMLIALYRSHDPKYGYNTSLGGEGFLMTEEQRQRLSERLKETWQNPEYRKRQSEQSRRMWDKEGYREKMSGENHWNYGHNRSEETRRKISETRKERHIPSPTLGKHLSEETRRKISEKHKGTHRKLSSTACENIRKAKLGKNNPNYGKPMTEATKAALLATHCRQCERIKDGIIERYSSIKEASDKTGICASNIQRACAGKRYSAGGFEWKYAEA